MQDNSKGYEICDKTSFEFSILIQEFEKCIVLKETLKIVLYDLIKTSILNISAKEKKIHISTYFFILYKYGKIWYYSASTITLWVCKKKKKIIHFNFVALIKLYKMKHRVFVIEWVLFHVQYYFTLGTVFPNTFYSPTPLLLWHVSNVSHRFLEIC